MRSGLILAGGESIRYGASKAFVTVHGSPMVRRVADALAGRCGEIIVAVGTSESEARIRKVVPEALVVRDARRGRGPIEGFARGFAAANGEVVLVAPCDAPLLMAELYDLLLKRLGHHEAAVPRLESMDPVRAVYRRRAVARVLSGDPEDVPSPSALVDRLDCVFLDAESIRKADPQLRSFVDVNRLEDLERALGEGDSDPG